MQVPRIETQRLVLRPLIPEDSRSMFAYRSSPEVGRFQFWRPEREEEVLEFIQEMLKSPFGAAGSWYQLAISRKDAPALIGDLGMHFLPPDGRQVEIGFTIAPAYQLKGYATEALTATLAYLFQILRKHRVVASVDPENTASRALLKKVGMRKEAHFRQSLWIDGCWKDDVVYAVLREEWQQQQA